MSKELQNLAVSVHTRLLNIAHKTERPFGELFQYFAMERFLYRLAQSKYQDQFVLKRALIFLAWGAPFTRPTRDIDLLGFTDNAVEHLITIVKEVCQQPVESDGMVYDPDSVIGVTIKEGADYEGVRLRLLGLLGNARARIQIDVGFADAISPGPIQLTYPTLLDMPSPQLLGYSRESVISEKLQAMVYLGSINSRMKDFYDVWMLSHQFDFDGITLQEAINQTFQRRNTVIPQGILDILTDSFADSKQTLWVAFLTRNRLKDIPDDFGLVINELDAFLSSVLQATSQQQSFVLRWENDGRWKR